MVYIILHIVWIKQNQVLKLVNMQFLYIVQ